MKWHHGEKALLARHARVGRANLMHIIAGNRGVSPTMAARLEASSAVILGDERRIPAESWLLREKFPHPLLREGV